MEETTIATLMAKKKELDAEMRAHSATAMKAEFRKFFDAHPNCLALRWRQYTPHWNDGEACTFSVHDIGFKLDDTPADVEDGYGEEGFEDRYSDRVRRATEAHRAVAAGVGELEKIDDEIFLLAFGDHVKVIATREGFEVEEYEHD